MVTGLPLSGRETGSSQGCLCTCVTLLAVSVRVGLLLSKAVEESMEELLTPAVFLRFIITNLYWLYSSVPRIWVCFAVFTSCLKMAIVVLPLRMFYVNFY